MSSVDRSAHTSAHAVEASAHDPEYPVVIYIETESTEAVSPYTTRALFIANTLGEALDAFAPNPLVGSRYVVEYRRAKDIRS